MRTMLSMLVLAAVLIGCQQTRLEESRVEWERLSASKGGNYEYVTGSGFVNGPYWQTTIRVVDGTVQSRTFKVFSSSSDLKAIVNWTEEGESLGTHLEDTDAASPETREERYNTHAAPLKTIGDLYDTCEQDILTQDRRERRIILEFDEQGILKTCATTSNPPLMDEGYEGVAIWNITFAP